MIHTSYESLTNTTQNSIFGLNLNLGSTYPVFEPYFSFALINPAVMSERKLGKIVIKPRNKLPYSSHRTLYDPGRTSSQKPRSAPRWEGKSRFSKHLIFLVAGSLAAILLAWLVFKAINKRPEAKASETQSNLPNQAAGKVATAPDLSEYHVEKDVFRNDKTLESFLREQNLKEGIVSGLKVKAAQAGLAKLEKGHEVLLLTPKDFNMGYSFFIYEMSPGVSAHIHPYPLPEINIVSRNLVKGKKTIGGVIKTTLWDAVYNCHINPKIIEQMEEAMKWSVDFYHLEAGDKFKLIYEVILEGERVEDVGQLLAVYFNTRQGEHFAFFVKELDVPGFLDEYGHPVKKTFLKSPVKYQRISSHYDKERIHPILKTVRPHLGTDYAAPKGDPVFAVGDGTVEAAAFTQNNGNYVKIRHDKVYETQYLHLDHFAEGIKNGSSVAQGQVIGYVGETGLATGPHVCFRFWKNGEQVDHLKEDFNKPLVMSLKEEEKFLAKKDSLHRELDAITYFGDNL
jgi:murein DD-endopeptidase MepM/ murein hydrolase activator NlpD